MNTSDKINALENRLHRLTVRDRENFGVRRKIKRQIRNLEKKQESK